MFVNSVSGKARPAGRRLPKRAYLLILLLAAAVAGTLAYGSFLGNLPFRLIPVIEAADQIKIEISLARLNAGAQTARAEAAETGIWSHYDRAENLVDFLLADGRSRIFNADKGVFRAVLLRTRDQIQLCREIAERRTQAPGRPAVLSALDRTMNTEFDRLLSLADEIHVQAGIVVRDTIADFRQVQIALILGSIGLALLSGVVVYRFDRRRVEDYTVIQSQNQQLQATEQQLRASNQQLQATEQQLRASNQQLLAGEQALRQSENRYRSLFQNMAEGMALLGIVYDQAGAPADCRIEDVNRQFEEIFGLSRDTVAGQSITRVPEIASGLSLEDYGRTAGTGEVLRVERYFPALDRHFLICLYSHEPGSCAAVFTDVTARKRAGALARREALRLETLMAIANYRAAGIKDLLEHAIDKALCMLDCSAGFIYYYSAQEQKFILNSCSRKAARECAIPQYEAGKGIADSGILREAVETLKPVVLNSLSPSASSRAGEQGMQRLLIVPVVRDSQPVAVACVGDRDADFDDRDGRELALLMDSVWKIVELRREQEERAKLETRIQKLESIGVLAGGIAHDFNNLLTAILANVTFAKVQARHGESVEGRFDEIQTACRRAQDLTQQLLTFARGGKPVVQLASLDSLIRESAALAVTGSKVQCRFRFADDLCTAEVDAGQISQAINNLVLNAVHAMPAGGTIRVEADNAYVDPDADLPLEAGRYVRISVVDTGIGIPREHLDRIFDPYFTTKQKGSGLGLAVTHSVITGHRGHIAVESRVGEGTAFHVYLPAACRSLARTAEMPQMRIAGSGRVLVMDDEEMLRRICAEILNRFGYEVETVSDGREAIERYEQRMKEGRTFDVVILDLTVPGGMGGKDAIREILKLDPRAKAVVSSGYSNDPVMADYRSHGFCGLVPKPYSMKTLSEAVNRIIRTTGKEGHA